MASGSAARLVVFTRWPEPGRVKTRLIPALGAEGAAGLHRALTRRTLEAARRCRAETGVGVEVRVTGAEPSSFEGLYGGDLAYRPQGEGGLGARMAAALAAPLRDGAPAAVLIGSDCPTLDSGVLRRAFELLAGEDADRVVLGPAADGGYYLVGLSRECPALFEGVDWGTAVVFRQSAEAAADLGRPLATLPPLADVDRPEDLPHWYASQRPRVTVVIPALDEEHAIAAAVASTRGPDGEPVEVVVADGGSLDRTAEVARSLGAVVVTGATGRAAQMNLGASRAHGEVLLFLHADSRLPADYARTVAETLAVPGVAAGAFGLRVDDPGGAFRRVEALVRWRSEALQRPYGDQAIFLPAATFRALGGFPDQRIMEDVALVRALRRRGRVALAAGEVVTSARRWREHGFWRTTLLNQACLLAYGVGVSAGTVARWRRGHAGPRRSSSAGSGPADGR